ncbi:hypothetical protein [Sphingomonas sp. LR55]|uniref:hypothetical protein n=1 Tax=Sphingomonas sp. LR55 TaxID=3050231 RepID=UPI002FDF2FD1
MLANAALAVGTYASFDTRILPVLIASAANLFWFGGGSAAPAEIADPNVGLTMVDLSVGGSMMISLTALFSLKKIRGKRRLGTYTSLYLPASRKPLTDGRRP